jgi:hypothetical protein
VGNEAAAAGVEPARAVVVGQPERRCRGGKRAAGADRMDQFAHAAILVSLRNALLIGLELNAENLMG